MSSELTYMNRRSDRGTVLVVDDEQWVRDLLSRWLVDAGWNCALAEGADEALEHLQWEPTDVIASDLRMPGHSGIWLLGQVKEHFSDTAVLMLTGSDDTQMAIKALTNGATGYLLKPLQREDFLDHVRQAWEHRYRIIDDRQHLENLESRVHEQTMATRLAQEETIHRLIIAAACRDEETGEHIQRTGLCSEVLALAAGWSATEAERLRIAAPMHDVGKIGIPDVILQKRGKLTPEEFETMKLHTTIGASMLAGSSSPVLQLAEQIALSHHEHWDGTGYPQGLSGEAIPEAARIVSIVDVYDALSHDRVYRPSFAEQHVLSVMEAGRGNQFDPGLLALFFTVFEDLHAISQRNPD